MAIEIGKHIVMDYPDAEQCSEKIVRCLLPEIPYEPPQTIVEVLSNAKCCRHDELVIHPGEIVVDKERCSLLTCEPPAIGGPVYGMENRLKTTRVYEDACGCCAYKGVLMRDGEHFSDGNHDRRVNITCIKGNLFHMERMPSDELLGDYVPLDNLVPHHANIHEDFKQDVACEQKCFSEWPQSKHIAEILTEMIENYAIESVAFLVEENVPRVDTFAQLIALALPLPEEANGYLTHFGHSCQNQADKCFFAYSVDRYVEAF